MSQHDLTFIPDPDADSISSDVAGFAGLLVSTQIPTRADGSLELGGIIEQSECTLQALKLALEEAGGVVLYQRKFPDQHPRHRWRDHPRHGPDWCRGRRLAGFDADSDPC